MRTAVAAALLCAPCVPALHAQVPGLTPAADTLLDTARVQLPTVRVTIAPTAGPVIGSAVPARVSIVTGREIEAWEPRTLADALSSQMGVSFYDDLGSPYKLNLSTRGFTVGPTLGLPSGVAVFLDGVRQNEPGAQEVNFDLLPMEHIERVELLSGAAPLLGRNALGGAVNLITRRGSGEPHGEVELAGGSFGQRSAEISFAGRTRGRFDYYVAGGHERERGWREETSASNANGFVNVGYQSPAIAARLQAFAARSIAETAGSLPESIFEVTPRVNFTGGDFEDLEAQQVALSVASGVPYGDASVTLFARRSAGERFNVNQPPDEDVRGFTTNRSLGGTADWHVPLARGAAAVRIGVDGAAHRVEALIFTEPPAGFAGTDSLTTDVRSATWDAAAFAIADYRLGRVGFSAGARYDYVRIPFRNLLDPADDTVSTYTRVNPRAGISFDAGGGAVAYASFGQGFRAPSVIELGCADPEAACPLPFALGDDPPLAPVRATTYEIGARWLRGGAVLNASAYRTDVRDEIFFVASEAARLDGYFTNVPRTRRVGAELGLQLWLPGERGFAYANYAWTEATFRSSAELFSMRADDDFEDSPLAGENDVRPGDHLPLIPRSQVRAGALLRAGRLELGADSRYTGRQWFRGDEANETRPLDPYVLTNVRAGARLGQAWEVAVIVNNVFDSRRAVFGTFNENRRTGELERFLTPLNARTVRVAIRRGFRRGE
jgi:iron complex outermembrane recepter protein